MNSSEIAAVKARRYFTPAAESGVYFNWAESVLLATAETLGLASDAVPRIATAFGGGMCRQGHVCGAVVGGLMAIGLAKGRSTNAEPPKAAMEAGTALQRRFQAAFGAMTCRDLTGCDLSTPEGQERFKATHQHEKCTPYVEWAARTVVELA